MMINFMIDEFGLGNIPIYKLKTKGSIIAEKKLVESKLKVADIDNYILLLKQFTKNDLFDSEGYAIIKGKGIIPKRIKPSLDYILD